MNSFCFKKEKVIEIFDKIKNDLKQKNEILKEAFDLDKKEWEYSPKIEELISIIEYVKKQEYLPVFSKEKIVDGFGKIALVTNQNPYIIFNFILSALYTNNEVEVILENKLLASNKVIIELIRKSLEELKYDSNIITFKEVINKEEIIEYQDNYDLLYYMGNKQNYIEFIKRIHIDSKFENFAEIYVYIDDKEFEKQFSKIDEFAYYNDIKVYYFNTDFEKSIEKINKTNNVNKISIIFTKNIDKAYEFVKKIKSENIYINLENIEEFKYNINLNNLVFSKNIKIGK